MSSCSLKRYVPEGEYLISRNTISIDSSDVAFEKSDLSSYISQKPYRGKFGTNFKTWVYYISEGKDNKKVWKWINGNMGEKPEYYSKSLANSSAKQMQLYLDNVGYFHSKVASSVETKRYKARVNYKVSTTTPYRIREIGYDIKDTTLAKYALRAKEELPVKTGDIYNAYTMDKQRDIVAERLRNSGYYYFTRDYISFEIDSNFRCHSMKVTMRIDNVKSPSTGQLEPHKRYHINSISIYPNFTPMAANRQPTDSTTLNVETGRRKWPNVLNFYYFGNPRIKPQTFSQIIQIYKGAPYRLRNVTQTYNAIGNLQLFSNSNIEFSPVKSSNDTLNLLDCKVMLQRTNVHSYKLEAEGTNSDGDLGVRGSISYTNKNLFRGAEVLQLTVKGGLEAQQIVGFGDLDEGGGVFNTKEFGINGSISFPKLLSPFNITTFARDYQPKTNLSLGYNTQIRYYYSRYIGIATFGYDWKSSSRMQNFLTPINLNSVKVDPVSVFQELLDLEENQRIKDQYTDHLILGAKYSFIYSTQNINKTGNFLYLRASVESSGNTLSLFNNTALITEKDGHHELLGIRYAQYLRTDCDFRQYFDLDHDSWLVFREMVGIGIPFGNSYDMPFERSFYSGGANGMRGWQYRELGPGSYVPASSNTDIERIGDIQLELNTEIRFPIYSIVNGAFFVDMGNIWNYHENESLPGGDFKFNTFYKQIAMDGGFGLRLDVKFVVLRLDCAMPFRNPYENDNGSHWRFDNMRFRDTRWVVGIGYPF